MTRNTTAENVASQLANAGISPDRVLHAGPGFREAAALWNTEVEREPAVVVRCASPEDVQAAVMLPPRPAAGLPEEKA